jgi:hypothetical protein
LSDIYVRQSSATDRFLIERNGHIFWVMLENAIESDGAAGRSVMLQAIDPAKYAEVHGATTSVPLASPDTQAGGAAEATTLSSDLVDAMFQSSDEQLLPPTAAPTPAVPESTPVVGGAKAPIQNAIGKKLRAAFARIQKNRSRRDGPVCVSLLDRAKIVLGWDTLETWQENVLVAAVITQPDGVLNAATGGGKTWLLAVASLMKAGVSAFLAPRVALVGDIEKTPVWISIQFQFVI